MYFYQTSPQDVFFGMVEIEKALAEEESSGDRYRLLQLIVECVRHVALAKGSRWEGDFHSMHVFSLPCPENTTTEMGLIWKQSNNGDTYICSPVALPWIDEGEMLFVKSQ